MANNHKSKRKMIAEINDLLVEREKLSNQYLVQKKINRSNFEVLENRINKRLYSLTEKVLPWRYAVVEHVDEYYVQVVSFHKIPDHIRVPSQRNPIINLVYNPHFSIGLKRGDKIDRDSFELDIDLNTWYH